MLWVTVQLSGWAKSRLTNRELDKVIRKAFPRNTLNFYYPVLEDTYGKQESPYSEYVFVSYDQNVDYFSLELLDEFVAVLKDSEAQQPILVDDADIERIKNQVEKDKELEPQDVVRIMEGALEGNYGVVQFSQDGEVNLEITVGNEIVSGSFPIRHVRKSPRRTKQLKKRQSSLYYDAIPDLSSLPSDTHNYQNLVFQSPDKPCLEEKDQGPVKIISIVRRGLKNTRVTTSNGSSMLISNDDLRRLQELGEVDKNI